MIALFMLAALAAAEPTTVTINCRGGSCSDNTFIGYDRTIIRGRGNTFSGNTIVDACPDGAPTRTITDKAGNTHVICLAPKKASTKPADR